MSSLFATLSTSSGSLAAFTRALDVTQNNISNASTAGYAAQNVNFESLAFDLNTGTSGGTTARVTSTRDAYADESVRREVSKQGTADQLTTNLTNVNRLFDVSGSTGVSGGLTQLFNSFSALSVTPNDPSARQNVITGAQAVASGFQQLAASLGTASSDAATAIQSNVSQVNALAQQIQGYNAERQQGGAGDAGLEAKLSAALENLSQITNISASTASDGTTTVLLGGQTPLVIGAQAFSIDSTLAPDGPGVPAYPAGTPAILIRDQSGRDITAQVTEGTLAGALQVRNSTLPAIRGDRSQQGSLNQLAQGFAVRVNTLLTSGNISTGPPAVPGVALFTYDATNPTRVATSLAVNPNISAAQIATIDPGPPVASNGIANKLSQIAQGTNPLDQIAGLGFTGFFGQIAAGVGSQLSVATDNQGLQQQTVAQAKNLQAQLSGVSLDNEAVKLLQYQNSYEAAAKLINVLDQVAQSAIAILPSV
jgi:flagellar hook-associated protein 1 FlgK